MSRATTLSAYDDKRDELMKGAFRASDDAVEDCLRNGEVVHRIRDDWKFVVGLYDGEVYIAFSTSEDKQSLLSGLWLDGMPDFDLSTYDVDRHAVDRMSQRGVTTGTINQMDESFVIIDRASDTTFKLQSYVDGEYHHAYVNVEDREIETVW